MCANLGVRYVTVGRDVGAVAQKGIGNLAEGANVRVGYQVTSFLNNTGVLNRCVLFKHGVLNS